MGPPFELLATCSLLHLSLKVAFLVALTLARRMAKMHGLTSKLPYRNIFKDKAYLCCHLIFLSKVVSNVHISQSIYFTTFYLKSHTNREEHCLQPLEGHLWTQIAIADRMKGLWVPSQRISSWITSCICYDLADISLLRKMAAHSTRLQLALAAFLVQVPYLGDLQSGNLVFISHVCVRLCHYSVLHRWC